MTNNNALQTGINPSPTSPNIIVTSTNPTPKNNSNTPSFILNKNLVILIVLVAASAGGFYLIKNKAQPVKKEAAAQPIQLKTAAHLPVVNESTTVQAQITSAFSGNPKYKEIIQLSETASNELDLTKRYLAYVKTFNKIADTYKQTKNPALKTMLINMKEYLSIMGDYKESEVIIPD